MLQHNLTFVDVETTGMNAVNGRIIEIGAIRVVNGEVAEEFQTLINPETRVDPFIESMTGIKSGTLESAPLFSDISDKLLSLFEDSVLVAHNARFDYAFIRNEFRRDGINFRVPNLCTVKLARLLYPTLGRYNLDSISEQFAIGIENRHRAFDDAKAIWEFYHLSEMNIPETIFIPAIEGLLKKPTLPASIPKTEIDQLPENPGCYIFYGDNGMPIYIGKSINLRDRVLSHFTNDYQSSTDMKIVQQIKAIETIETAGELSALLLESSLIKKHQPLLNRMLRQSKKMVLVLKTLDSDGYNTVHFSEPDKIEIGEIANILGVFKNKKQAINYLSGLAQEHTLCPKILGLEKGKGACFYTQLGKCNGACAGRENQLKYNLRFDEAVYARKVKPWNYPGPVLIKEEGVERQAHIVDQWCYLGSIADEHSGWKDLKSEYRFDFDTYKILARFIRNPVNAKRITTINLTNGRGSSLSYNPI